MTEYTPKQRAKHCATTRANIVHDLMIHDAATYFVGLQGSRVLDLSGLKLFTLEDHGSQVAIRLKKLDDHLLSRNQQTQQVKDFRGQKQIDFLGSAYHLEAGYVLDRDQLNIQMVSLVCPNGTDNYWDIQLTATAAVNKVRDLFDAEPVDDKVNIVRPKTTGNTEKPSENEGKDQ